MKSIDQTHRRRTREAKGSRTRQEILLTAVHIASCEGLEGLTIGRLAEQLQLSKSGLFAHFGSKEELQLAVIGAARDIFVREVVEPAFKRERGIPRILGFVEEWLGYVGRSVFRGGCFFMACSVEFDSRPGKVRELIVELSRSWMDTIADEVRYAQSAGQLTSSVDAEQMMFEIHGLVHEANWSYTLFEDARAFERARIAISDRLRLAATRTGLRQISVDKPKPTRHAKKR